MYSQYIRVLFVKIVCPYFQREKEKKFTYTLFIQSENKKLYDVIDNSHICSHMFGNILFLINHEWNKHMILSNNHIEY